MNCNFKDETGNRYGKLTVISCEIVKGKAFWKCKCDCGNITTVAGDKLRRGVTKSCGCIQQEHRKEGFNKSHGMTNTRLYSEWCNMKARCNNPRSLMYGNYGDRGIKVCEEWRKFENFMSWALLHGYSDELTIERKDVNGDYEPSNCKWITPTEQYLNRTDTHLITAFGKTQTIKEWADETGLKYDTIHARVMYYGWSGEEAVTRKPHHKKGGGSSGC